MPYTILQDNSTVEKPINDDRLYRLLKIDNNDLHVLVIHDPEADKAAASLDVNVGSYADKNYDIAGLAHFCEHLLFMGTEKYPEENEYSSYLSKHSGYSNAYTAAEHTNYYFQLSSDYLEGALDRFAQFFIAPLFSKSCKDREIQAVDSENKKNLQDDMWRLYQLDKLNSNPDHPYNGFSTGNFQTLHVDPTDRGLNVRDILIDFHGSHYSSNLMSLVILGKEDLDTLSKWAIEKFSAVPNKSLPRPNYDGKVIYTPEYLNKIIKAKPIKDDHKLELSFMIPDDLELKWKTKPASYYSHLLGHESKGSILHHLKSKGWVTGLSSGNMKVCQGNSVYIAELELTPTGLDHWQEIVVTVFQYLKLILDNEPKKWIWEEVANISKINFRFKQKAEASSTVSRMSNTLYKFATDGSIPPQYLLSSGVDREFGPEEIKQFGTYLNAENFRISLVSQTLEGLDSKEKWYGTEYSVENIPSALKQSITNVELNPELHYPDPNEFIPENFDILKKKSESPLVHPYLIADTERIQVWFKQDDRFEVPKGSIEILLHLPSSNEDIRSSTLSALVAELLDDELNQITYYASLVGLKVKISCWREGFHIEVSGYNDKLPALAEQVLNKFVNFKPNQERFEAVKYKLTQDLRNFGYHAAYNQIGTHFLLLVNEKTYKHEDKANVLDDITFNELYEFTTKSVWKSGLFTELFVHGNFEINKATEIKKFVLHQTADIKTISENKENILKHVRLTNHVLPAGEIVRYELPLQDPNNINSCIEYYIQISPNSKDRKTHVLTNLLSTIIKEPSFNQLRTKEQLGYVVFSGIKQGRTSLGFRVLIQSERTTDYLEYRIEEFLAKFGRYVNDQLSDEDFAKFKQALIDTKLSKMKHLKEETARLFNSIADGYYDFNVRVEHVKILESIEKKDFINFFNEQIAGNNPKLIVHLKSQKPPNVTPIKLVESSLINYVFRHDLDISSEVLTKIVSESPEDYKKIAAEVAGILEDKIDSEDLFTTIKAEVVDPVPHKYPTGKLFTNVDEFRAKYETGGISEPVQPLSDFYYPENDSHL